MTGSSRVLEKIRADALRSIKPDALSSNHGDAVLHVNWSKLAAAGKREQVPELLRPRPPRDDDSDDKIYKTSL